jgi:hypothetical protein
MTVKISVEKTDISCFGYCAFTVTILYVLNTSTRFYSLFHGGFLVDLFSDPGEKWRIPPKR